MRKGIAVLATVLLSCIMSSALRAETGEIPAILGFHSAITDEGGNAIADGDVGIKFRITDANGAELYEESQMVSAANGLVSALIGNGLTQDGAPAGGVPMNVLDPQGARYLEVEVEGIATLPPMEIASVPYAAYAQQALGVANGSISFDSLSADAMKRITEALTNGKDASQILLRDELPTLYSAPAASSTIGVAGGLTYSTANYLQAALADLDKAIAGSNAKITAETGERSAAVSAEAQARVAADSSETSARAAADSAEADTRAVADAATNASVANLDGRVQAIENPQRLSFGRSAWGTVTCGLSPAVHGQNAVFSSSSGSTVSVAFVQPMSDAYYSVVVTPTADGIDTYSINLHPLLAFNKSAAGFSVNCNNVPSVDFIVMGN